MGLSVAGADLTFDVPTYSFGFYATGLNANASSSFSLYVGADYISLPNTIEGGIAYYGVVFDHTIQNVRIFLSRNNAPVDKVGLDGFSFNTAAAAPVPEPAGWALLLAGLGLVGRQARRPRAGTATTTTTATPTTQEHA
jgi:hypothetical protein